MSHHCWICGIVAGVAAVVVLAVATGLYIWFAPPDDMHDV